MSNPVLKGLVPRNAFEPKLVTYAVFPFKLHIFIRHIFERFTFLPRSSENSYLYITRKNLN